MLLLQFNIAVTMSTNEENPAATQNSDPSEPLLGRAGDASQQEGKGLEVNFVLGTLP